MFRSTPDFILFAFGLVMLLLLSSCSGDNPADLGPDTVAPQITIEEATPAIQTAEVCGASATNVMLVETGGEIALDLAFTDDRALGEYKIDIHHNFDCHSHGKRLMAPWQMIKVEPLAGDRERVAEQIEVPADATVGDYHLLIQALDAEGNEAPFIELSLKLRNPGDTTVPTVTITQPEEGAVYGRGTELRLAGTITDNRDLGGGRVDVTYFNAQGTEFTAAQVFFDATVGTSATFDVPFTLPASLPVGNYDFHFHAYDAMGNVSETTVRVRFE